jgi:hypothetical protein
MSWRIANVNSTGVEYRLDAWYSYSPQYWSRHLKILNVLHVDNPPLTETAGNQLLSYHNSFSRAKVGGAQSKDAVRL